MTYKEALLAFSNELKERTKPNEELHFYYKQIEKTLDFEPKDADRFLKFYTDILVKELTNLKEGGDLENAINILFSTNEKVCNLQLPL